MEFEENTEVVNSTEVTEVAVKPFTLDDATEEKSSCLNCEYHAQCPIIVYVNKLSMKRDGVELTDSWSCSTWENLNG